MSVQPVVITGQPGVGKSTVCAELAKRQRRGAHVKADDLHRMIVAGGQWPSAGTEDARRQLVTRTRSAGQIARNLSDIGVRPFVDEVVAAPEQLAVLDAILGSAHWVVLTASPAMVLARDTARSKHTATAYLATGAAIVELLSGRAQVIDTDELGVRETADRVEAVLEGSIVAPGPAGPVWWLVEVMVRPENVTRLEKLTREMREVARDEPGTQAYERFRIDETTFHFYERYASADAAVAHLEAFKRRFASRLHATVSRQRFHTYGPASDDLIRSLAPYGAVFTEPWPETERGA